MKSTTHTHTTANGGHVLHYIQELIALQHYLQPGMPPLGDSFGWKQPEPDEMAYLGEVELRFAFRGTLRELTQDPVLQTRIQEMAKAAQVLTDEWPGPHNTRSTTRLDEVELALECGQIFAGVEVPFSRLSLREQAYYRMRVLLVNTQGVLNGSGHSWALAIGEEQAIDLYGTRGVQTTNWHTKCNDAEGKIVEMLLLAQVDLRKWCTPESPYYADEEDLPDTPPLAWVKKRTIARLLFRLSDKQTDEDLERAIAFALYAFAMDKPQHIRARLFLADVLVLDQPTLQECATRVADRLSTLSALSSYADDVRVASSVEQINAVLKKVYDAAPHLGVWIIA